MIRNVKINDIKTALAIFEDSSIKQAEATEIGDYKTGNKHYNEIVKAANFIRSINAINKLKPFLTHSSVGVRMWAACYYLSVDKDIGLKVLDEITKGSNIHALTAETTLSEWKKGNLKF